MTGLREVCVLVFVLALSGQRHLVDAENAGGCQLFLETGAPVSDDSWTFDEVVPTSVKDSAAVGEVVYTYGCSGVSSITKVETTQPSPGVDYVTYRLNADLTELTVVVTPAFDDYEATESLAGVTLNAQVTFQCSAGASDMKFRVNVDLSNNHDPEFAVGTGDVQTLAMPQPNGQTVATVTVADIDIGNTGISLSMDAVSQQSFQFGPPKVTGKVYEFQLKTTKQIYLEDLTTVTVTAKDSSQGAERTAVATLSFQPDVALSTPPSPRFTDALYLGALDEEPAVDSDIPLATPITFAEGYDAAEVTVSIASAENADPSLFEVVMVGAIAHVRVKAALPADVLSKAFLILVLQADRTNAANTGRTVVHVTLPAGVTTTTSTQATTTTTGTTVTTTACPPPVTCPTEEPSTCPPPVTCPTEEPSTCPPPVTCPTEEPSTCPPPVTCPTEEPSTCPPPVTCPTEEPSTCPPPVTCPTEGPTTCPECPLECTTPTTATTTTAVTCEPCTTECPTENTTPTECPVTCEPCTTTCPATTTTGTTATSTCPTCPTECPTESTTTGCPVTCEPCTTTCPATTTTGPTDCPLDCSQCPTQGTTTCPGSSTETTAPTSTSTGPTTTPVDEGSLTFEQEAYDAEIEASYTGFVLRVTAVDDRHREVQYDIETSSSVISNRVTVDASGSVNVNKLPPGTFGFTIAATVPGTSLYAFTKVTIRAQSVTLCGDVPQFEYALSVISVLEGVEQVVIPGMTAVDGTDCRYSLDSEDFFSIDASTGTLTSKAVDRESELFVDMVTPQVAVHLQVQCSEHPARRGRETRHAGIEGRDEGLDYSEIESVESDKQKMTVVAVIEDANDNAPVFAARSPLVVGYPSEELAAQLSPASLVTVQATDKDAGKNAEIAYSLSADSDDGRFFVHPTTGTVYVLASASTYTDQGLTVVATDRDGEGLSSAPPLDIQVRILSRQQVTEVLIEGALLEQVDDVVEAMSLETTLEVRCLAASVLPSLAAKSTPGADRVSSRFDGFLAKFSVWRDLDADADEASQTVLKMVVYAVDGQIVVSSDEFKTQMAGFDSWAVQDIRQLAPNADSASNDGLLAAVIALGVVVALLVVAGGVVFYVYYVRPRMSSNEQLQDLINSGYVDSNSDASSTAESKDVEADGKANVTSWLHMAGDTKDTDPDAKNYSSDFDDLQKSPQDVKLNMEGSSHILSQFIMPEHSEVFNASVGAGVGLGAFRADSDSEKDGREDAKEGDEFGTKKKGRKKSVVTFNESVDCIEIEKM